MQKKWKKIIIFSLCVILFLAFCYFENHHLTTSFYTYSSSKLSDDFDGFRIVQLSDIHNVKLGYKNKKLINRIKELKPDIVVITGDLVDSNYTNIDSKIEFVKSIVNICPVYFVTGNHEYWLNDEKFVAFMSGVEETGAIILSDELTHIKSNESSFHLIGLDDNSLQGSILESLLDSEKDQDTLNILLAHEPQNFMYYNRGGADLVLAGHAHGGQFRLPFIKNFQGLIAPDQGFFPKYTSGEFFFDDMEMIVSRGLGNSIIPIRLFNDPEIVCIDLEGEKTSTTSDAADSETTLDSETISDSVDYSYEIMKDDESLYAPNGQQLTSEFFERIEFSKPNEVLTKINKSLEQESHHYLTEYSCKEYAEGVYQESPDAFLNDCYISYSEVQDVYLDEEYLSIIMSSDWYAGGVANMDYVAYNYSLKTGDAVTLADLVSDTSFSDKALKEILIREIPKEFSGDMLSYDYADTIQSRNLKDFMFYMDENNYYICINTYEVAAGAEGSRCIKVEKNKLK